MRGVASTQRDRGLLSQATLPQSQATLVSKQAQEKTTVSRERLEKGRAMLASVNRKTRQVESGQESISVREQAAKQQNVSMTARSHRRAAPADLLGRELATHVAYTSMMSAFQEWQQLAHVAWFRRSWVSYKTLQHLHDHAHRSKVAKQFTLRKLRKAFGHFRQFLRCNKAQAAMIYEGDCSRYVYLAQSAFYVLGLRVRQNRGRAERIQRIDPLEISRRRLRLWFIRWSDETLIIARRRHIGEQAKRRKACRAFHRWFARATASSLHAAHAFAAAVKMFKERHQRLAFTQWRVWGAASAFWRVRSAVGEQMYWDRRRDHYFSTLKEVAVRRMSEAASVAIYHSRLLHGALRIWRAYQRPDGYHTSWDFVIPMKRCFRRWDHYSNGSKVERSRNHRRTVAGILVKDKPTFVTNRNPVHPENDPRTLVQAVIDTGLKRRVFQALILEYLGRMLHYHTNQSYLGQLVQAWKSLARTEWFYKWGMKRRGLNRLRHNVPLARFLREQLGLAERITKTLAQTRSLRALQQNAAQNRSRPASTATPFKHPNASILSNNQHTRARPILRPFRPQALSSNKRREQLGEQDVAATEHSATSSDPRTTLSQETPSAPSSNTNGWLPMPSYPQGPMLDEHRYTSTLARIARSRRAAASDRDRGEAQQEATVRSLAEQPVGLRKPSSSARPVSLGSSPKVSSRGDADVSMSFQAGARSKHGVVQEQSAFPAQSHLPISSHSAASAWDVL